MPSRPPTPKPRGPKATRVDTGRILDAAQEVFSEAGLRGGSIRAIAQRAGCDPALIYYHFESKEALFLALLDRKLPPLAQDLERLARPEDLRPMGLRLWEVLRVYRAHLGQDAGFRAVLRGEIARGTENTREAIAKYLRQTAGCLWALIEQGQARGELRKDLDPVLAGFFLVKLFMEILEVIPPMAQPLTGRDPRQALEAAQRAWFELYWRGVAADPHSPLPPELAYTEPPCE